MSEHRHRWVCADCGKVGPGPIHGNSGTIRSTKLAPADVAEIRRRWRMGEKQVSLAIDFGVAQSTVFHIVHRNTWNVT